MSETGATSADDQLDDPGRDPKGRTPPRNPLSGGVGASSGGPDQDSGQGAPDASPGIEGQSMMPESPTEDDDRA
jgi:hypothetical protein